MAKSEAITEFNQLIDSVIEQQVRAAQTGGLRRSWPGMDSHAKAAGIDFYKLAPRDGRSIGLGMNLGKEVMRAVVTQRTIAAKQDDRQVTFRNSTISFRTHGNQLMDRHISVPTTVQLSFGFTYTRELEEAEQLAVVEYARSPHLAWDRVAQLAVLSETELDDLLPRYDADIERDRVLHDDLAALARGRSRHIPPSNEAIY